MQPADGVQHLADFVGFVATGDFIAEDGGGYPKLQLVADGFFVARVVGVGLRVALSAAPCAPRAYRTKKEPRIAVSLMLRGFKRGQRL